MKFEELALDPRILSGIKNAGFDTPTPIQEQAIPKVLDGRDVLGLAQTGTGKTAAFILPILQRLTRGPLRRVRALVIAPTRELAEQIHETAVELGKHTKIRSFPVYGGVSKGPQLNAIKRGTEIIVACPGRLLDHINEGNINLSGVEVLVLDEADRMCDMGFLPDIRRLLKHLPRERQNLFFSATMPTEIRKLADDMLTKPTSVQIGMIAPAKTVSHALYPVPQSRKKGLLFSLLGEFDTDQVLIFTRTKRRARFLARDLEKRGYNVCALQGNMAQNRRQEAINGFRDGKYKILVATDIAARGIDVAEISHVINFDMPDTVDAYTHRIGRTGRAHAEGEAFTFVDPADEGMVREIEKLLGTKIERRHVDDFDYSQQSQANGHAPRKTHNNGRRNATRDSQNKRNSRDHSSEQTKRSRTGSNNLRHRHNEGPEDERKNNAGRRATQRTNSSHAGRDDKQQPDGKRRRKHGGQGGKKAEPKHQGERGRRYRRADVSNLGLGEDVDVKPLRVKTDEPDKENVATPSRLKKRQKAIRPNKRNRVRLPKRNKSGLVDRQDDKG